MTSADMGRLRLQPALLLVLLSILLAGLFTACGGSDSDEGAAPSDNTGSGANSVSATPPIEATDVSDDASSTLLEGCAALIFIFQTREVDNEVPFDQAENALREMARVESSVQADLQLVSQSYGPFFELLRDMGIDNLAEYNDLDAEASARVDAVVATLETPEVRTASRNIDDFIDREC